MKSFLKLLLTASLVAGAATACYNDAVLKSDISDLQDRVRVLEAQYIKANENIVTLQSLDRSSREQIHRRFVPGEIEEFT